VTHDQINTIIQQALNTVQVQHAQEIANLQATISNLQNANALQLQQILVRLNQPTPPITGSGTTPPVAPPPTTGVAPVVSGDPIILTYKGKWTQPMLDEVREKVNAHNIARTGEPFSGSDEELIDYNDYRINVG
jgi:hypothetical protein